MAESHAVMELVREKSQTSSVQHVAGSGAGAEAWLALGSCWSALLTAPEHQDVWLGATPRVWGCYVCIRGGAGWHSGPRARPTPSSNPLSVCSEAESARPQEGMRHRTGPWFAQVH